MADAPALPATGSVVAYESRNGLALANCAGALALFCIVIFHANGAVRNLGGPAPGWPDMLVQGVDFIFVLSGFAIMRMHEAEIGRPAAIARYLVRWGIRLFPVLWLIVLADAAGRWWGGGGVDPNLLFRSLIPYPSLEAAAPHAIWILRHEMLFCLAFAVLLLSGRAGAILFGAWALAAVGQLALAVAGAPVTGMASFFLSTFLLDFLLGVALARLHRGHRFRPAIWPLALGIAMLAAYLPFESALHLNRLNSLDYTSPGATLGVLIIGLIFTLILHGLLRLERSSPAPRALLLLGGLSYVLYLVHIPVNSIVHNMLPIVPDIGLAWGVGQGLLVAAAMVAAFALYFSFVKPVLRFLRLRLSGNGGLGDGAPGQAQRDGQEQTYPADHYAQQPDGGSVSWLSKMFGRNPAEPPLDEDFEPLAAEDFESQATEGAPATDDPASEASAPDGESMSRVFTPRQAGHSLPRFSAAGAGRGIPAAQADRLRKTRAAFTPSHPIADASLFAGRHDLLLRLIHLIEDQKLHVVLYGDRGIGKTSVLRVLSTLAREAHYNVMYASCGSDTDFDSLLRSIVNEIPLLFHADYDPTSAEVEAGGVFADLLPDRPVTVADLTTLLEAVRGTQLLVIIDEFDRVESSRMREQVAELIKNLSDRGAPVQCLIAGVASNLTALVSHIPSIRRNLIGLPIGPLGDEEIREVLHNAAQRSGVSFSDSAETLMIRFSTGLPYLAQLLGLHASLLAVRAEQDVVSDSDVLVAIGHAVDEIRLRISPRGARVVEGVAQQIGWTRLGELARRALLQVGELSTEDVSGLDDRIKSELLVNTTEEEESARWAFVEEAIVPYVWLNARLEESTPARFAASRTFQQLEEASLRRGSLDQ